MTRSEVEARLRPDDPVTVRQARKPYRCRAAEPIDCWRVYTTSRTVPDGQPLGEGWRSVGGSQADAEAVAAQLVGAVSNRNHITREVTGRYATAEARAVPNRHHDPAGGCLGDIAPGDLYIEDSNDAPAYQAGIRFCLPCGLRLWGQR